MPTDIDALPVHVAPEDGEHGTGFLLRAAYRNGVSLGQLLSWLGLKSLCDPTAESLWLLSTATRAPADWLATRLPVRHRHARHQTVEWMGHTWTCELALRGKNPQICPQCLHDGLPCQSSWELTGAFACLRHRCLLVDRCERCGRRLSWQRPAPDVCRCGHYLTRGALNTIGGEPLQWVSAFLTKAVSDLPEGNPRFSAPSLPPWLEWLSPDGMFVLTYAAGLRDRPSSYVAPQSRGISMPPSEVATMVDRGLRRLRSMKSLDEPCSMELRCLLFDEALERLAVRGATEADREIAQEVRRWSGQTGRKMAGEARRRVHGQIDLFR